MNLLIQLFIASVVSSTLCTLEEYIEYKIKVKRKNKNIREDADNGGTENDR